MTKQRLFFAFLLVDFVALTGYAIATEGFGGLWTFLVELGPWGWQIFVDLVLALGMCMYWMHRDARRRGASATWAMVATVLTGSIGALAYMARRPDDER